MSFIDVANQSKKLEEDKMSEKKLKLGDTWEFILYRLSLDRIRQKIKDNQTSFFEFLNDQVKYEIDKLLNNKEKSDKGKPREFPRVFSFCILSEFDLLFARPKYQSKMYCENWPPSLSKLKSYTYHLTYQEIEEIDNLGNCCWKKPEIEFVSPYDPENGKFVNGKSVKGFFAFSQIYAPARPLEDILGDGTLRPVIEKYAFRIFKSFGAEDLAILWRVENFIEFRELGLSLAKNTSLTKTTTELLFSPRYYGVFDKETTKQSSLSEEAGLEVPNNKPSSNPLDIHFRTDISLGKFENKENVLTTPIEKISQILKDIKSSKKYGGLIRFELYKAFGVYDFLIYWIPQSSITGCQVFNLFNRFFTELATSDIRIHTLSTTVLLPFDKAKPGQS